HHGRPGTRPAEALVVLRAGRPVVARGAVGQGLGLALLGREVPARARALLTLEADVCAVVAGVADPVGILIPLLRVGDGRAEVARIADPVAVGIELVGVRSSLTVVASRRARDRVATMAVAVGVGRGTIARARIAGVADPVVVHVVLVGIRR